MGRKNCIAMLLAGGQGSRLGCLTANIAKPGLSFGGKYRIIDFSLSNCVNSGIETVGVLTQYKPYLLNSYMGIGSAWDLDSEQGGVRVLPPYMDTRGGRWYKGTANAIYQNMDFIDANNPHYVLVLSGDHIYKMDYSKMLERHIQSKADATIAVLEVTIEEASRFGIMSADEDGNITKFAEKPKKPESTLASMGIYIFTWETLRGALNEDEADPESDNDFGKNIIPQMLAQGKKLVTHRFEGYWKDVGTISSYYEANMELLSAQPELDLFDDSFRIFSNTHILPPQFVGEKGEVSRSLVSNGCTILGKVSGSVLAPGIYLDHGAQVTDSVLLPGCRVGKGAKIHRAIIGENAVIGEGCTIGGDGNAISIVENDHIVPANGVYSAGSSIQKQGGNTNV